MQLPSISIVTPSLNQGQYLDECIDSVLSQNYPNLEYIIMDGGSNDNSLEIIKKYEKYLTYWQSKPDGGQYAAIQEGFSRSSGKIMAWLNSDDKYHEDAFFTVAYVFATHPEIEWITGRPTWWDKDGRLNKISDVLCQYDREKYLLMGQTRQWMQQESTFWSRSLWERAGAFIRTDLGYAGDFELWVRYSRSAQIYSVNALLGGYRTHGYQKAVYALDKYLEEVALVTNEELARGERVYDLINSDDPRSIEIDSISMKYYFAGVLPLGESPHFSLHQVYVCFLQERNSLDILVSRLKCKIDELLNNQISLDEFKSSISWRMTAPLRKLLDVLQSMWR